jgi:hypothetical protein
VLGRFSWFDTNLARHMPNYLNVNWLHDNATLIHYFGLGFIQIKLGEEERLHIYTKQFPSITSYEDIHNHRYDFTSYVLRGVLHQEIWTFEDRPNYAATYEMTAETCQMASVEQPVKAPLKILGAIDKIFDMTLVEGSSYNLDYRQFHRVKPLGDAVTLVRRAGFSEGKSGYLQEHADVIRPKGSKPVCPFSQKIPEDELWKAVVRVLK